jgi:hypothetical protein
MALREDGASVSVEFTIVPPRNEADRLIASSSIQWHEGQRLLLNPNRTNTGPIGRMVFRSGSASQKFV